MNNIIEYPKHPEFPQTLPRCITGWLGINQRRLLAFCLQYPNEWHSYNTDTVTVRTVRSLSRKVPLELSTISNQFRFNK